MASIITTINKLEKFQTESLEALVLKVVQENDKPAIDFNKEQLGRGVTTKPVPIRFYKGKGTYRKSTELIAKYSNPKPKKPKIAGQPYNMQWDGVLFDNLQLIVDQTEALFASDTSRLSKLKQAGYFDLLGLTPKNQVTYVEQILKPKILIGIKQLLLP